MAKKPTELIIGYYKNFKSVWGALAGATGCYVIISALFPANVSYGFPPMGDGTIVCLVGFVLLFVALTFLSFHITSRAVRRNLIVWSIIAAFPALAAYAVCHWKFVRKVDIPAISSSALVSVGYERTTFAQKNFKEVSDWEMLRQRGPYEEQIWGLWTTRSIILARLSLLTSFFLFTAALVLAFSLGVRNLTADVGVV